MSTQKTDTRKEERRSFKCKTRSPRGLSRERSAVSWLGRGGLWRRSLYQASKSPATTGNGVKPVKMRLRPQEVQTTTGLFPLSRAVFPKCIYLSRPFWHKSAIIHMYPALLSCAHVSLNKAIKAQKTHCESWIAFIDQAHVKTHVNSSYYFGFVARKMEWKELKALTRVMLTQLGPVWVLCRNSSTARWNVFIALKENTQKASFKNKWDNQGRLIENARWAMLLKGSSSAFLYTHAKKIFFADKILFSSQVVSRERSLLRNYALHVKNE